MTVISGLIAKHASNKQITNEVGRSLFAKAGELGAPVGIMVMKVKDTFLHQMYVHVPSMSYYAHFSFFVAHTIFRGYNGTLSSMLSIEN